jgi:acyl carrier protein
VDGDLEKVTEIVRNVFDEYDGPVTRALSARDVVQWDSLMNVQFMVSIEHVFGVRFNTRELGNFQNLGEVLDAVKAKRAGERIVHRP